MVLALLLLSSLSATIWLYRNYQSSKALEREHKTRYRQLHHHVGNSLQSLSLLSLIQAENESQSGLRSILMDNQSRIEAINLIHKHCYQQRKLGPLNLKLFLFSLVKNLIFRYGISKQDIEIQINMSSIELPLNKSVSFGLVINELMLNAFNHALNSVNPKLKISFSEEADHLILIISDADSPAYHRHEKTLSFSAPTGTRLAEILISQLNGTIYRRDSPGIYWCLRLPEL